MRAVTVLQFIGLRTCGTRQQLIAQTDTHARTDSLIIQEGADMLHRLAALLWVARTVSQEQAVELQLVEIIVPRHTNDLDATFDQTADDIGLYATID